MFKKISIVLLTIVFLLMFVASVSASTYTVSNSTDVNTINKMISGKIPIKNNKFIKDGDVVKFKSGNYNNLKLVVKKSVTLTKKKGEVTFIGNNTGIAIKLTNKKKKVNINKIKIRNYEYGIYGKTNSAKISKMTFYKNSYKGIAIKGNKVTIAKNYFVKNEAESISIVGKNNIISSNKMSGGLYSSLIYVRGSNNLIKYNKIRNSESSAIIVYGNKNKISKNRVYKCSSGIYVNGNRNTISYNKAYKTGSSYGDKGISIDGKYSIVNYNIVKDSVWGLNIWGEKNTASYNKLYKNKVGINYFEGNKLLKNKFIKNNKKTKKEDKSKYELHY